jgi:hypothetical protein
VSHGDHNLLAVTAAFAVVALCLAVAAGVFAFARTHSDQKRIRELEAKVHTLCARQAVTGITQARSGKITALTEKGC